MVSVTKFAIVAGVVAVAAGTAHAADLPARVAPAPYIAPLPIFTWTGAYFGINAGAAFDNKQEFTTTADRSDGIGNTRFSDSGFSALPTGSFLNFFHSSAVTVKAEYLRYELDSSNLRSTDVNTVNLPAGLKVKNEGNIARIGLNYKF